MIPEMARRLQTGEELHLLVSPKSRHLYQGYGPGVFYLTYPWSNERRTPRTLSEHLYSPPPAAARPHIDVFNTLMAPIVNLSWSLVIHMKTMHAFTTPDAISPPATSVPPDELSVFGPGRGCDRHQLRELALGDRSVT